MELPTALIIGVDRVGRGFGECSPGAPAQRPADPPPRARRARAALARGLIRLAHAVAPPEPGLPLTPLRR